MRGITIALLLLASACTASPPTNGVGSTGTAPSRPSEMVAGCTGQDCEYHDKEIKTTPCHEPAVDASAKRESAISLGIKADVVIRKSAANGAGCDRLYWGKLDMSEYRETPNTQGYVLSLRASGSDVTTQESDNPALEALTRTMKARTGEILKACVSPAGSVDEVCVEVEVV